LGVRQADGHKFYGGIARFISKAMKKYPLKIPPLFSEVRPLENRNAQNEFYDFQRKQHASQADFLRPQMQKKIAKSATKNTASEP